jgi:hypothetical protein
MPGLPFVPDQFIQGIVSANIFARQKQLTLTVKQRTGMKATGLGEGPLLSTETMREIV